MILWNYQKIKNVKLSIANWITPIVLVWWSLLFQGLMIIKYKEINGMRNLTISSSHNVPKTSVEAMPLWTNALERLSIVSCTIFIINEWWYGSIEFLKRYAFQKFHTLDLSQVHNMRSYQSLFSAYLEWCKERSETEAQNLQVHAFTSALGKRRKTQTSLWNFSMTLVAACVWHPKIRYWAAGVSWSFRASSTHKKSFLSGNLIVCSAGMSVFD